MDNRHNDSLAAVMRMKEYIAAHLQEPITAQDLAKAAGYSQYHAARMFKGETGLSPFEYLRRERLTASAHLLRSGRHKVVDVALDFVFDSHEGFTRAFVNGFGISPKKYATRPAPEGWQIPFHYLDRSKLHAEVSNMSKTTVIFTQIIDRPARRFILKRSKGADDYFSYAEEIGCGKNNASAAWDVLSEIKEALYEPVGVWLPEGMCPPGTGTYAHGVEVPANYTGPLPEGFDVIDLVPCQYIVFQGEPYKDENYGEAVSACMERIKSFNPEVYGYQYATDMAPRMQLEPQGWRGYIEMLPVKRMNEH